MPFSVMNFIAQEVQLLNTPPLPRLYCHMHCHAALKTIKKERGRYHVIFLSHNNTIEIEMELYDIK